MLGVKRELTQDDEIIPLTDATRPLGYVLYVSVPIHHEASLMNSSDELFTEAICKLSQLETPEYYKNGLPSHQGLSSLTEAETQSASGSSTLNPTVAPWQPTFNTFGYQSTYL